jgi:hypothetical protein
VSQLIVAEVTGAAVAAFDALTVRAQIVLAVIFHQGGDLAGAAEAAGLSVEDAQRVHDESILAVHDSMLRAVSEGTPAPDGRPMLPIAG